MRRVLRRNLRESMEPLFSLRKSTVVEPLVNRWSAYSQCISPLTASLYVNHYQTPNLKQYLQSPELAVEACKNPKYRAGRFVNIPVARAKEVEVFLAETEKEYADSIRMAQDVLKFQAQLAAGAAAGLPLAPFYNRVPDSLRGYVELLYDYFTRPGMRVIEPMLYESKHYRPHLQSFRLFSLKNDRARDFIFSTPRLPSAGELDWQVPFNDPRVDALFALDTNPQPLAKIRELLGVTSAADDLLRTLFVEAKEPAPRQYESDHIHVQHFGHACVLIEWNGKTILVDPCFGPTPTDETGRRLSYEDLPAHIDYVLITHNHHDHYSLETLLRIRHRLGCLVVPRSYGLHYGDISLKLLSTKLGFNNVVEVDALDSLPFPGGRIVAVPFLGEHSDLPHAKSAYVIEIGKQRMLFAADSDCLDPRQYEHLADILGPVQTVFLGLECVGAPMSWTCGAFFPVKPTMQQDQSRRQHGSDSERGMRMLRALGARRLYVYAMGLEPWYEWLLGLAYTDDAQQIKEMKKILVDARNAGLLEARLLTAKTTITIGQVQEEEASYSLT
jgi:L-ascorbate metabolism protein UlaG (beta-lactamase superfamily)